VTRDLNLWYEEFQALINVTAEHPARADHLAHRPSGCGKTTLLRCFNRVNERYAYVTTTGEIKVLNKNIYDPMSR
jgi:phosphate transport system ATP-binding protein